MGGVNILALMFCGGTVLVTANYVLEFTPRGGGWDDGPVGFFTCRSGRMGTRAFDSVSMDFKVSAPRTIAIIILIIK